MSKTWNAFVTECRDRYGVAAVRHARKYGIAESTFYRRTEREGWSEPYPGVRTAPWVKPSLHTALSALLTAAGDRAAATGTTAAWLHGLSPPPKHPEIAIPHGQRVPLGAEPRVRRHRWLRDEDLTVVDSLAVLSLPAMMLTLANRPRLELRAMIIDALHGDLVELAAIGARLSEVGPIPGRRQLALILHELADREAESIFHDVVLDELTRRGYRPNRAPIRIETPDGRGVHADIPLTDWRIAIEVQGDRFHSTRAQRAADRRKSAQYAGTGWLIVEVDWWEWMGNRDHFLQALDAAIVTQSRNGVAEPAALPPHLRQHSIEPTRVQTPPPGADQGILTRNRTH